MIKSLEKVSTKEAATTSVFTKQFMTASLLRYLHLKECSVYEEELGLKDRAVMLCKNNFGAREIIEIKGYLKEPIKETSSERKAVYEKILHQHETIFSYLVSLSRKFHHQTLPVSVCLPSLPRFKSMIRELRKYFMDNHLHLHVYMIDEMGGVEKLDMNTPQISRCLY